MLLAPLIMKEVEKEMAEQAGDGGKTDVKATGHIDFEAITKDAKDGGKEAMEAAKGGAGDKAAGGR